MAHGLLVLIASLAGGATGQPQMCKEYLGLAGCQDAGCRWATVGPAAANGPTCTRQCHEFGGAAAAGTDASKIECVSEAIGCRWIQHPTNTGLGKCGKLCAEFKVCSNCALAGYGTCRWATPDVTGGGPAQCTKQCAEITDPDWCTRIHCVWLPNKGSCRRKCIEFSVKGQCEAIGCVWVTPQDGYHLSQCIPPGPLPGTFVNQTNGSSIKTNETDTFYAEGQHFKWPVSLKAKQFGKFLQSPVNARKR